MNKKEFEKIIIEFREECIKYKEPILVDIKDTNQDFKNKIFYPKSIINPELPFEPLYNIIKSPRNLKSILRRVYSSWQRLHGEVNLDDLILSTVLKILAPEAFTFLIENYDNIIDDKQTKINDPSRNDDSKTPSTFESNLNDFIKNTYDGNDNIKEIILFLVPDKNTRNSPYKPHEKYFFQKIIRNNAEPYFTRLIREDAIDSDLKDQEILTSIKKYDPKDDQYKVDNFLQNEHAEEILMDFQRNQLLTIKDIKIITSKLLEIIRTLIKKDENYEIENKHYQILQKFFLFFYFDDYTFSEKNDRPWFINEIKESLKISLKLSRQLISTSQSLLLRSTKNKNDFILKILDIFITCYESTPDLLIKLIKQLSNIDKINKSNRNDNISLFFDNRELLDIEKQAKPQITKIFEIFIKATKSDPNSMWPIILPLLYDNSFQSKEVPLYLSPKESPTYSSDFTKNLESLFREQFKDLNKDTKTDSYVTAMASQLQIPT